MTLFSSLELCIQGALRLQNDTFDDRGRIEICNIDVWGTICDDSWTSVDAGVVCIQLGLPSSGIQFKHHNQYGVVIMPVLVNHLGAVAVQAGETADGSGQVWLDSVVCTDSNTRLTDCTISAFGNHNCSHSQDVGVICQGKATSSSKNPKQ